MDLRPTYSDTTEIKRDRPGGEGSVASDSFLGTASQPPCWVSVCEDNPEHWQLPGDILNWWRMIITSLEDGETTYASE